MKNTRIEKDTLGEVTLPDTAYYGAQTRRAKQNFPISNLLPKREYIISVVLIKKAAAMVNNKLGLLETKKAKAIIDACDAILKGKFLEHFIVDPYQAGAGTSHNMNANEVIANIANEYLDAPLGSYTYIHPNDHVNMSQSTNDVIPTAIRIMSLLLLHELEPQLNQLQIVLEKKSKEFSKVLKSGRTHLQDAMPITLGQEFSGYAEAIKQDTRRLDETKAFLYHIGIGGTAVGTGINTHPKYHKLMVKELSQLTHLTLKSSPNFFDSLQNTSDYLHISCALRIIAQNIIRIGNDLRLLSSGPHTGFAEIKLPDVQPGSSIMPGKINPSIIEMTTMVCFQVIGYDQAILMASQAGQLELNVFLPLIAHNLSEQITLLTNALKQFNKTINGIKANEDMCLKWFTKSSGLGAILNTYIGYGKAAEIVKHAVKNHLTIEETVVKMNIFTNEKAKQIFSIDQLTKPNL